MEFPEMTRSRFYNGEALSDQTDFIDYQCTPTDVASVWTSILTYWFPPDEGYQIRLNHTDAWVEVYVIRVASRPRETDISFSPVFVIRCYGAGRDVPIMPLWPQTMVEIPSSVTRICHSVNAAGRPAHGAVTCADLVRLCFFDPRDLHMEACDAWPDIYFLSLLKDQIQEYLNHVKAEFARTWEEPYVRYFENEISSPLIKDEMSVAGDVLMDIEANDGENSGGVPTVETWTGTGNASSMETSSAGSSDLDTDSDISEILKMNGIGGTNGINGVNSANGHVDTVMELQEGTADRNGDSSINNQEVPHTNGVLVTIEFIRNGTLR